MTSVQAGMAPRRGFGPTSGEPPKEGSGAKSAYVPRWTSGRECWVFRAEKPEQLCGYHAQLIESALAPGEPLQYLLYSPVFDAREGPFQVGGGPASHALAVTPQRLVVSRDPHAEGGSRSVTSIALGTVSSVEIGCALALGWFVTTEVKPLTAESEQALAVLRSPERWTTEKRRWRTRQVCASAAGLLVATSRGLLWASSEPRMKPDGFSFGVNVAVVRPERVLDAAIGTRVAHDATVAVLRVHAGDRPHPHELEVPFDAADVGSAEEIVRLARAWRGRP